MINIADSPMASKRVTRAKWIGYTACTWASLFALMHFYWGVEASATGILTLPDRNIKLWDGPITGSKAIPAWIITIGMLCVLCGLIALFRTRGEKMSRNMQLSATGLGMVTMTAYVVYSMTVNGFVWLIAPGTICAFGAAIALALIQPWGRFIPRWLLLLLAWLGGAIMIVHELYGGLMQVLAVTGVLTWQQQHILIGAPSNQAPLTVQQVIQSNLIWGTWFLLGGILFCILAWLARRPFTEHFSK